MINFIQKLKRLARYRRAINITPIDKLYDYVGQLSAIYSYTNGVDYRESQKDILNLRIAELSFKINEQLKYIGRRNS